MTSTAADIVEVIKEIYNNPTARPSSEDNHSDGADVAKPEPNSRAETHQFVRSNKGKMRGRLCRAAINGDWKTAKSVIDIDSSTLTKEITDAGDTALHIAAAGKHISLVENLVQLMSSFDLTVRNKNGNTALTIAAESGVVKIAKVMVDKNPALPNLHDPKKPTPILVAITYKHKDMASFLFSKTNFEALDAYDQFELLIASISTDYYDIALDILKKKPKLALERREENGDTALHVLARKSSIGSRSELSFWRRYSCFKEIYNKALMQTLARQIVERVWDVVIYNLTICELSKFIETPSRLLHDAASVGNVEFLILLVRSYPDLLYKVDDDDKSMFHVAVENRQESVFTLLYKTWGLQYVIANYYDKKTNSNMLHLAGKLAAPCHLSRVSGAFLQMQRELLWFKAVEKVVLSSHGQQRCHYVVWRDRVDNLTPRELFTKEHGKLQRKAEKEIKNTALSCLLVATPIAIIVVVAAFTISGVNHGNTWQKHAFRLFKISDVTAAVSSTTSMVTFLSIFKCYYAEDVYLVMLPAMLLIGLVMLFVSGVCMVMAFSAAFCIAYHKTKAMILLAIWAVTIIPFGYVCVLHSKLVVGILHSAYWYKFSLRRCRRCFFSIKMLQK